MPSNPISILVSSAGTSRAINLDWMEGGPATVQVTAGSSTGSAGGVLQYTLNDILTTPSSNVVWSPCSSGASPIGSTTGVVLTTSGLVDAGFGFQFLPPVAALRFSCSAFSSGGLRVSVLQG
jgi:hypothetical protein